MTVMQETLGIRRSGRNGRSCPAGVQVAAPRIGTQAPCAGDTPPATVIRMTGRHLLALPRCAALLVLSTTGLVVAVLSGLSAALLAVGLLPVYIAAMAVVRRLAELGRGLAAA